MNAAIADPQTADEQLVVERPTSILFMARRRELRLVMEPRVPIMAASGFKQGETPGKALQFVNGRLDVPADRDAEMTLDNGNRIPAGEVLDFLTGNDETGRRPHRCLGDVNEGFWVVDQQAPAPTSEELMAVIGAATELNADMLEKIVEQERQGWGREAILNAAEGALQRVRDVIAQAQAEADTQAQAAAHDAAKAQEQADRDAAAAEAERQRIAAEAGEKLAE